MGENKFESMAPMAPEENVEGGMEQGKDRVDQIIERLNEMRSDALKIDGKELDAEGAGVDKRPETREKRGLLKKVVLALTLFVAAVVAEEGALPQKAEAKSLRLDKLVSDVIGQEKRGGSQGHKNHDSRPSRSKSSNKRHDRDDRDDGIYLPTPSEAGKVLREIKRGKKVSEDWKETWKNIGKSPEQIEAEDKLEKKLEKVAGETADMKFSYEAASSDKEKIKIRKKAQRLVKELWRAREYAKKASTPEAIASFNSVCSEVEALLKEMGLPAVNYYLVVE